MGRINDDYHLFLKQSGNTKLSRWANSNVESNVKYALVVFLGLTSIIASGLFANFFPIVYVSVWLFIPLWILFCRLFKLNIHKKIRKVLIAIVILQSVGIYFSRNDVADFIGERYISGYESWETVVLDSSSEVDSERRAHAWRTDTFIGGVIIRIVRTIYIVLIIIIPYAAWKLGQSKNFGPSRCIFGFHAWSDDCEICSRCGSTRTNMHNIENGTCKKCKRGILIDERDGRSYQVVRIGERVWMAENLAFETGKGCWAHSKDESTVNEFGYIYNWKTAMNICPDGYHLPTDNEWKELERTLGMSAEEADLEGDRGGEEISNILKSKSGWDNDANGNNKSKFNALPVGCRFSEGKYFLNNGISGHWWSSSEVDEKNVWSHFLHVSSKIGVIRKPDSKKMGYSVRCIRN